MLASFRDRFTEEFWRAGHSRRFGASLSKAARRKLAQLHFATTINDLRVPPGNRLEALSGDRRGQHSIRINAQWRICFVWREGNAYDVEITDYH
jgi:proteic killer suppression protein